MVFFLSLKLLAPGITEANKSFKNYFPKNKLQLTLTFIY